MLNHHGLSEKVVRKRAGYDILWCMTPPYDEVELNEFAGYFESKEPEQRERADAWATAIGLQKVDGLTPSRFLVETARAHIEGVITQSEAQRRIRAYYEAKDEIAKPDPSKEEPDKVAERMVAVINDGGFEFTPEYYISIHKKIFSGILASAGSLRAHNIGKREWVLKDDSVTYGDKDSLLSSLVRDFQDEREFDYGGKSPGNIIPHFVRFLAQIWQVHPFAEGNTRTTAVFAIKYLRSLGYRAASNMFKDYSWYFRNALVRANYADYARGVSREWGYLEAFFRNLLLGETHELKSRYLLIGTGYEPPRFVTTESVGVVRKGCQKTREVLIDLIRHNPRISQAAMASTLSISRQAVQKHLAGLKASGHLRRIGPDKGGRWEIGHA